MRARLFDAGVCAGIAFLAWGERGSGPVVYAIGLAMAAALLARRRFPVATAAVVYLLAPLHLFAGGTVRAYDLAVLVAMYSVVKYAERLLWGILAGVGAAIGVLIVCILVPRFFWSLPILYGAASLAAWFTAYAVRTRHLYVAALEERAATLERERDYLGRLAAADVRADVARELHDVVAHSLSVMIVQADGARYALGRSPENVPGALDTIAATGRDALEDMRRIVEVLRDGQGEERDGDRRRAGIAELDTLVARAEAAGLRIARRTEGEPVPLTAAEELTAYRIVQESLTNVLRHAGPHTGVEVVLSYMDGGLSIVVADDGPARSPAPEGCEGHGIRGMRERAAVHGGTFAAGPRFEGGWRVEALLPLKAKP
ncbi:sensor histidine kinase [Virgisporangium aliadipatigenens]|uniref:sensor histidine kinase n=1 Tax=Virgisporangium aliadipatigenens TaxID=741659 RepID=UPI0019447430|nr:histidine kinase [Virgisporangium aliadipatigenens]